MLSDVFISHASEDKEGFVRALAERLRQEHVEVWYDEFSLKLGDSLRRSIDRGLSQARFGIVVLSPSFFKKRWSEWELDGLVARQNSGTESIILPVWHEVGRDEVLAYSPSLADKLAVASTLGVDEVARRLLAVIRHQGSTLVIARDHLISYGLAPPVISDDWWLDVAVFAEGNDMEGGFQESMGWGRWGFPLPSADREPQGRGWRLARAALQMLWQQEAATIPITQLTHPDQVHEFIHSQPGLAETCQENIRYLIAYAPQLVIRDFGGKFEPQIEALYLRSVELCEHGRACGSIEGSALTIDGRAPGCGDDYILRDAEFGSYQASHAACGFVQGNNVASGPPVKYYSHIDYVAWLLSVKSQWLPTDIRDVLTRGMSEWGVWPWTPNEQVAVELGFEEGSFTGKFAEELQNSPNLASFHVDEEVLQELIHRLSFSAEMLDLPEDGELLATRVLSPDFLGPYFAKRERRRKKKSK